MKKLSVFISLLVGANLAAQPSLDYSNYVPSVGTSVTYYVIDSTYSPGASGANVTWDFTNMKKYNNLTNTVYIVNPSQTPYASQFSGASYADTAQGQNTTYYSWNSFDVKNHGYVFKGIQSLGDVLIKFSNDQEIVMQFPFTYNTTFTDNFSGSVSSSQGLSGTVSGSVTVTGDGYGTLKLPYNVTLNNILRVKMQENATVTTLLGQFTLSGTTYLFYDTSNTNKLPILKFYDLNLNGNQVKYVHSIYDAPVSVKEYAQNNQFSIYPNPVSNVLNISLSKPLKAVVEIMDVTGKTIHQEVMSSQSSFLQMNVAGWPAGVYFISISDENGVRSVSRFIKE